MNAAVPPGTIESFRRGDEAAFLAVYDAYNGELRSMVRRMFLSPFDREEAVQESWLQIHRVRLRFDPERGPLGGWLQTIAINRCKEILRARGRRPQARDSTDDLDLTSNEPAPDEAVRSGRVQFAMATFLHKLKPEEARVFQLSLLEEQSHDQVASAMGISSRRCKYLRMKLLLRAASDTGLAAALAEVTKP